MLTSGSPITTINASLKNISFAFIVSTVTSENETIVDMTWKPYNSSWGPHWFQIDLHTPVTLQRLGIQGSEIDDCWVTYYNVSYTTLSNANWTDYEENGEVKVCFCFING